MGIHCPKLVLYQYGAFVLKYKETIYEPLDLKIPDKDVLIHTDDVTRGGTKEQVVDFFRMVC